MASNFEYTSDPLQVGVCPTCGAPVDVRIKTVVYPSELGRMQMVYHRYLYTCEECGNNWAHTKAPYFRKNSNDLSEDKLGKEGCGYYADALACFLERRETTDPRPTHI